MCLVNMQELIYEAIFKSKLPKIQNITIYRKYTKFLEKT